MEAASEQSTFAPSSGSFVPGSGSDPSTDDASPNSGNDLKHSQDERWPEATLTPPSEESADVMSIHRTFSLNSNTTNFTANRASGTSDPSHKRKRTLRHLKGRSPIGDPISFEESHRPVPSSESTTSEPSAPITVESKITSEQLARVKSKRKSSVRTKATRSSKQPASGGDTPSEAEVDRQFIAVLQAMDLSDEQLSRLESYSLDKKWRMICDSGHHDNNVKHTPRYLTDKIRGVLKDKSYKDASQVIKTMEILLRSAQINWLNVFLSPSVDGLSAVMTLLESMQVIVRSERSKKLSKKEEKEKLVDGQSSNPDRTKSLVKQAGSKSLVKQAGKKWGRSASSSQIPANLQNADTASLFSARSSSLLRSTSTKQGRNYPPPNVDASSLNLSFDYVSMAHDILLLLRAIMNSELGFLAVTNHRNALDLVAACLFDTQPKTRLLVLELLSVACMLEGVHHRVVEAMDYNRRTYQEECRFDSLVQQFRDPPHTMPQDYLCASLNFFNIIVHSPFNLNFRVHLQYELSALGFDEILVAHRRSPNLDPLLEKQINAYFDNFLDVQIMLDSYSNPPKNVADQDTKQENQRLREEIANSETRYVAKIAELESNLRDMHKSIEMLTEGDGRGMASSRAASMTSLAAGNTTSSECIKQKDVSQPADGPVPTSDSQSAKTQAHSATDGTQAETTGNGCKQADSRERVLEKKRSLDKTLSSSAAQPAPPPCNPPAGPMPPPPPGMMTKQQPKKMVRTKYTLPALNWQVLHKTSWKSTVFASINPDFYQSLDMGSFEENFKLRTQPNEKDQKSSAKRLHSAPVALPKVLDANFCRNIGILQRKLSIPAPELAEKVACFQVDSCDGDILEQLTKFQPTSTELQKFERMEKNNTISSLMPQEQFVWELYRTPRFHAKLRSTVYMINFRSSVEFIQPQLQAVYVAGSAVTSSPAMRKMFELIMAFGNYANSSRRGWTNGFQIISLDSLKTMKATDGSRHLLHYISDFISERPEYNNIFNELVGLARASQVVLSQMVNELSQLVNGMMLLRAEDKKGHSKQDELFNFLDTAKQTVSDLERLSNGAQEAFEEATEYLGEVYKAQSPGEIFGPLSRFLKDLKAAEKENEKNRRLAAESERKRKIAAAAVVSASKRPLLQQDSAHKETANQLEDIFKMRANRSQPQGGFMDEMIQASKVVAYRPQR